MPTPQAEILYPKAAAILEDMEKLEEEINSAKETISGELIIGASTIPGAYVLPSLAAQFKKEFQGISFEIRISDSQNVINDIVNHTIMMGVVGAKIPFKRVQYHPFIEDELIAIAGSGQDIPEQLSLTELIEQPFILREQGSGTRKSIELMLAQNSMSGSQLNVTAVLGSSTAIKEAVKAGLGISIISRLAVQEEIERGQIKQLHVEGFSSQRSFYIVTLQNRTLPNHYRIFLNRLCQRAEA